MPHHLHTERSYCGAALCVVLTVSLLGAVSSSPSGESERALITGRATCGGHPVGSMWIVFEKIGPRGCNVASPVMADGSFRLEPRRGSGLPPGVYRIRFGRRNRGVVRGYRTMLGNLAWRGKGDFRDAGSGSLTA